VQGAPAQTPEAEVDKPVLPAGRAVGSAGNPLQVLRQAVMARAWRGAAVAAMARASRVAVAARVVGLEPAGPRVKGVLANAMSRQTQGESRASAWFESPPARKIRSFVCKPH
jgi:hypothetical protein